jgi:hypothetical protein
MTSNGPTPASQSSEKRNFNFVMLRRGFREHLPGMSGNAVKLYVWLHLSASFSGPMRGYGVASYEDIARSLRWNQKALQRALTEMECRYIEIQRAANQHELTTIRIIKYDLEESTPAVDKSVQSKSPAVDAGVDSGVDKSVQSDVHSNGPNSENRKELQASKNVVEVKKEKNGKSDAVRRPFDAELRPINPSPKSASRFKKNQNLAGRLAKKIREAGHSESYPGLIEHYKKKGWEHPFGNDERAAFGALQYQPDLTSPVLSTDFVYAVVYVFEENLGKNISPGNLCSKVIDFCECERKKNKTLGSEDPGYYYPPDFVQHRNKLRAGERVAEQQSGKPAGVRA